MSKHFEKNLELWSHTHPKEAVWFQYFECQYVEICKTNGKPNLRKSEQYLHDPVNPVAEAKEKVASLDLENIDVLYLYGVGLGYFYDALKKWLKQSRDHHVVFLEDDPEVIYRLFETERGSKILSDPQVHLYYFNKISDAEQAFNQLYWLFAMSKIGFGALPYYEQTKSQRFAELQHQISYNASVKNGLLEEYLQFGIAFYRNFYPNMLRINESYLGNSLFSQFQNVPAIICGAGPSLQKNILHLKKIGDKAILFAGSSAINALAAEGIQPHLGVGIDPNPMQEERLKKVANLHFPFLYRNRIYPEALNLIKGPKLYVTGAGGYDTAVWFEEKFGIDGELIEEGRNVVNFCLEIAHAMGCNPIIFVGMDLAYTNMKAYSPGVISDNKVSKQELFQAAVLKKDIHGNDIYTLWKWVSEAKWIGDFSEMHPEVTLINATEGGIGFPGVPNKSLKDVQKEFLEKKHPIHSAIMKTVKAHSLSGITKQQIKDSFQELSSSLERCIEKLVRLAEENEKVKQKIQKSKKVSFIQTPQAALIETELLDEPAFIYVLQIFNDVCSKLMTKDLMQLHDPRNKLSKAKKELLKLELNSEKYRFLIKTAHINRELLLLSLLK